MQQAIPQYEVIANVHCAPGKYFDLPGAQKCGLEIVGIRE